MCKMVDCRRTLPQQAIQSWPDCKGRNGLYVHKEVPQYFLNNFQEPDIV
jgi:hypothetical protein